MKKMLKPEIEFIRFNAEDVITTSGEPSKLAGFTKPAQMDNTEKSTSTDWTGLGWNIQQ